MTTQCVQVKLELGHKATYRKKPTPDGHTHDWVMFVRGPEGCNIKYFVEKVVFHLHKSFPKPKRVIKEPPYQVQESGYAGFIILIDVYFKNKEEPRKVRFEYDLFLHLENCPPVNHIRCEKLTFNNPTEDFRRKLLKAGGVGVFPDSLPAHAAQPGVAPPPPPPQQVAASFPNDSLFAPDTYKPKPSGHSADKKQKSSHIAKEPVKPGGTTAKYSSAKDGGGGREGKAASKEPKSAAAKAAQQQQQQQQQAKRPQSPSVSSQDVAVKKKRKRSTSTSSEISMKAASKEEKAKQKEKGKGAKGGKPSAKAAAAAAAAAESAELFSSPAEVKVEKKPVGRPPRQTPPAARKELPPFEAELSTEEVEGDEGEDGEEGGPGHSPSSSTSFSSMPVGGAGALGTLMAELPPENEEEEEDEEEDVYRHRVQYRLSEDESKCSSTSTSPLGSAPPTLAPDPARHLANNAGSLLSLSPPEKPAVGGKGKGRGKAKGERRPPAGGRGKGGNRYLEELVQLHQQLVSLTDKEHLQKVVDVIGETGLYTTTSTTFDFDLCSLDRNTVKKLQSCLQGLAR